MSKTKKVLQCGSISFEKEKWNEDSKDDLENVRYKYPFHLLAVFPPESPVLCQTSSLITECSMYKQSGHEDEVGPRDSMCEPGTQTGAQGE